MNVVVIAAHGLNCHWLGPYGNEWISTPAIDALACESILFDRHFANDPSPAGFRRDALPGNLEAFAVLVDDRKQPTSDDSRWNQVIRTEPAAHKTPGDALKAAVKTALEIVAKHEHWLLWIETDRLIPPWDFEYETYKEYAEASGGFIETREVENEEPIDEPTAGRIDPNDLSLWHRLHNSFAAAVTSFDAELMKLIEMFRRRGLDESAAWILTSGYGWPLGEHGVVGPSASRLHEELVHLPLIVRQPDARGAMHRVQDFTQPSDLAPTILDLLGVRGPGSLPPIMTEQAASGREFCRYATGTQRGLRTDEWAFLPATGDQPVRLYSKPDDIWEVNDLAQRHPDECDALQAKVEPQ
jgi:arylsulfatase A-like enzyme